MADKVNRQRNSRSPERNYPIHLVQEGISDGERALAPTTLLALLGTIGFVLFIELLRAQTLDASARIFRAAHQASSFPA
jgi:hypothetical protein